MLEIRILFCISLPSILLAMNTDNKSPNSTDSNIKPKVWVETGQMHQRSDNIVDHNENTILDDNNELMSYNTSVQLGQTAFLICKVAPGVESNQVSWVRRRDWHILSSGDSLYTNDARFVATHEPTQSTYTLQIKFVQKRDHGVYECQVATSTGVMSHYASLQVVVPEAFILGSGELHVDMGSALNLVCIIEKSPTPPQYVYWQRNNHMINYDDSRRDVTIETTPGPRTQSRLIIREPQISDSGNYTCSASNTEPASIYVFVSKGDNTAAISRRNTSSEFRCTFQYVLCISLGSFLLSKRWLAHLSVLIMHRTTEIYEISSFDGISKSCAKVFGEEQTINLWATGERRMRDLEMEEM